MNLIDGVLSSTFFLTVLLMVGLISFLKSSIKDRTTEMIFKTKNDVNDDRLLMQVRNYLLGRSYTVAKLDATQETVTLSGNVKPSVALAILLTSLAAIGFVSLGLVLGTLVPWFQDAWWLLSLGAPIAGIFYWRGADRQEEISLALRPNACLWVRGHKDELTQMQRSLDLERLE